VSPNLRGNGAAFLLSSAIALLCLAPEAMAKKVRYEGGPPAEPDTVLSTADVVVDPIVRSRGPRVPATNLQLTSMVANTAFERALESAPFDSGQAIVLAPAESHPLNFVAEHAILRALAKRRMTIAARRSMIPDDSLAIVAGNPGEPVLDYQLASARVTYLRFRGWLPGRVQIERQALVEGRLTLRDPHDARILWTGDASYNLVDAFPRNQLPLVEDSRFTDLQGVVPDRTITKVAEPVIVIAVVAGLVALFFANRP
jgi:hypothetical protein